jgi:hypothetical protein
MLINTYISSHLIYISNTIFLTVRNDLYFIQIISFVFNSFIKTLNKAIELIFSSLGHK